METKNKTRLEKKLSIEKKNKNSLDRIATQVQSEKKKKDDEMEAQRQLEIELLHQREEAETRALGQAMLADAAANRPSFNQSSLNLLNNYQGILL